MGGSCNLASVYAQSPHVNHRTLLVPFAALLLLAACKPEPKVPAGVISRDKFVAANIAVRTLPESAAQAQREAALKKAGVTDRQLRAWVTAHARQPETLSKAWEEIAFKVDSIGGGIPLPNGGVPQPGPEPAQQPPPPPAGAAPPPPPPPAVGTPQPPILTLDTAGGRPLRRPRRLEVPPEERGRRKPPVTVQ